VSVEQALWFIVGVLALIVGLGISIGLHEWGHFAPAQALRCGYHQVHGGLWSHRLVNPAR